jgi:hypothetical protein
MLRQYMIRPSRGWNGPRFYKFEDVLAAAMLRHGRGGLADKMCALASREDVKARVWRERWHSVWDVVSTKGVAEDYLTMSVVYPYAKDFVDTGRGGIRGFERRIRRHRTFSFLVSRCTGNASLYLRPLERIKVSHLQLAYVLTRKDEFVTDAQRVVREMRLASGVVG